MLGPEEFVVIGKVLRPHGLRGDVKVLPFTDDPSRFRLLSKVYLRKTEDDAGLFNVEGIRLQKNYVLLKLKELRSIEQAEQLRGAEILILRRDCLPLPSDAFYIFDLIGARVITTDDVEIGVVADVLEYPANDVYVVRSGENEILIPAVSQIVKQVDIAKATIVIEAMDGLLP